MYAAKAEKVETAPAETTPAGALIGIEVIDEPSPDEWKYLFVEMLHVAAGTSAQRYTAETRRRQPLSPREIISGLFDDTDVMHELSRGQTFPGEVDAQVRTLKELADQVPLDLAADDLVNLPTWKAFSACAKQVLAVLDPEAKLRPWHLVLE